MAGKVGHFLKKSYQNGTFLKVDLKHILMTTQDMDNKGDVTYHLNIPFVRVSDSCQAATAFDHRGGWNHEITKNQALSPFKLKRHLDYIELKTPEGLQEFWIQWQHNQFQKGCP